MRELVARLPPHWTEAPADLNIAAALMAPGGAEPDPTLYHGPWVLGPGLMLPEVKALIGRRPDIFRIIMVGQEEHIVMQPQAEWGTDVNWPQPAALFTGRLAVIVADSKKHQSMKN